MIKKIISVFLLSLMLLSLASCSDEVYGHAELTVELPDDYEKIEIESFDASYRNVDSVVGIIRISFSAGYNNGIPDTLMPGEFAQFYMKKTEKDSVVEKYGDVAYYQYTAEIDGLKQSYLASFYRSPYAYFVMIFACPEELYEENKVKFLQYTQTVRFVD